MSTIENRRQFGLAGLGYPDPAERVSTLREAPPKGLASSRASGKLGSDGCEPSSPLTTSLPTTIWDSNLADLRQHVDDAGVGRLAREM